MTILFIDAIGADQEARAHGRDDGAGRRSPDRGKVFPSNSFSVDASSIGSLRLLSQIYGRKFMN